MPGGLTVLRNSCATGLKKYSSCCLLAIELSEQFTHALPEVPRFRQPESSSREDFDAMPLPHARRVPKSRIRIISRLGWAPVWRVGFPRQVRHAGRNIFRFRTLNQRTGTLRCRVSSGDRVRPPSSPRTEGHAHPSLVPRAVIKIARKSEAVVLGWAHPAPCRLVDLVRD